MAFTITIHTDISEYNLHILAKVLLFIVYTYKVVWGKKKVWHHLFHERASFRQAAKWLALIQDHKPTEHMSLSSTEMYADMLEFKHCFGKKESRVGHKMSGFFSSSFFVCVNCMFFQSPWMRSFNLICVYATVHARLKNSLHICA